DVCLAPEPSNALNDASTMIKVVEYMAVERPIVAFDLPETRYSAGEAALYAPANDEAQFALLVARLLDDPDERARRGAQGRGRLERNLWGARPRGPFPGARAAATTPAGGGWARPLRRQRRGERGVGPRAGAPRRRAPGPRFRGRLRMRQAGRVRPRPPRRPL